MAFREANVLNPLIRVEVGVEALDHLFARGKHAGRAIEDLPAVVLPDLNLPRLGGIEVLAALRGDGRTRHLPVVSLTSSSTDKDRLGAYDNLANSYIQKPVDHDRFVTAARQLGLYWTLLNLPAPPNVR